MGATQRVVRLLPTEALWFFDDLAENFAAKDGYLKVAGRPVVSVLNLPDFEQAYGTEGLRYLLRLLRVRLHRRLGVDPFIIGLLPDGKEKSIRVAAEMPCDAITGYGLLPDWTGPPVQSYEQLIDQRVAEWYRIQRRLSVPFLPVVCVGWDASRRGEHMSDLRSVRSFPWRPVITGGSSELFGTFIEHAKTFLDATEAPHRVVFIHAWNEWSEGSAIEPGMSSGYGFLREVRSRLS